MRIAAVVAHLVTAAMAISAVTAFGGPSPQHSGGSDVLYVAPAGRGSSCHRDDPCALPTARDRVRGLLPGAKGDVDVDLLGGTYRLTSPLRLGVQDSGRPGHRVVYQAAPGQTPILSGADRVTGFTRIDATKNI